MTLLRPNRYPPTEPRPSSTRPPISRPRDLPGYPVHLTASTRLTPDGGDSVDALGLAASEEGVAIEIDAIKFQLAPVSGPSVNTSLGAVVGCSLSLGRIPLAAAPVPVWLLGRLEDLFAEPGGTTGTAAGAQAEFRWELDRPLYVPAGEILVPTLQHRGYGNLSVDVRVSYEARSLPRGYPIPSKLDVPWVGFYQSKNFVLDNTRDTDQSRQADLINPFAVPLNVSRFAGRLPLTVVSSGSTITQEDGPSDFDDTLLNVRMVDSRGNQIVREPTPFRMVFERAERGWNCPHVLPPRAYHRIYLDSTGQLPAALSVTTVGLQAQVAMIGWRSVQRATGARAPGESGEEP